MTVLPAAAASTQEGPIKVMVVSGLQDLGCLHEATQWLDDTMANMSRPKHAGTHTKSNNWGGLLWVKFPSTAGRDMMVALVRSAGMKIGTANVSATQDLPIPVRAR